MRLTEGGTATVVASHFALSYQHIHGETVLRKNNELGLVCIRNVFYIWPHHCADTKLRFDLPQVPWRESLTIDSRLTLSCGACFGQLNKALRSYGNFSRLRNKSDRQ